MKTNNYMKHKSMEILFYWGSNQALIYKEIEWAIMLDVQELYQKHKHKPKKKKNYIANILSLLWRIRQFL